MSVYINPEGRRQVDPPDLTPVDRRRQIRADMKRRRDHGKAKRHAARLRQLAERRPEGPADAA